MDEIIVLKVLKKEAQKEIMKIKQNNNFNANYKIKTEKDHILIPINKITKEINKRNVLKIKTFKKQKEIGLSYKDILSKEKVPEKIIKQLPSAYDIVGDIVIINIENKEIVEKYKDKIGCALIKTHPHTKVVLNKEKEHHGTYRTQDFTHLCGENRRETTIKENNCLLKTDVEKVFYSTRLVTERKRIASLVKPNERVGVFFAGVGPFAIEICKLSNPKEIIAIELNPIGFKYLKENIIINKMQEKIIPIKGDVKKESKNYKDYFDRIPMPLPKSAEDFLNEAIYSIKDKGIIHIYNFVSKNDPFTKLIEIIKNKEKENGCKIEIINKKILRSFSQTTVQVVLDLKIKKN